MRSLLLAATLALVSLSGCAKAKENKQDKEQPAAAAINDPPTITMDEVEAAVKAKQAQAIDCNDDSTRKTLGVLPGAILLSGYELYPVSELPADKNTKLIFYCFDLG